MAIPCKPTTWNGTSSELEELLSAVQHNCSCSYVQGARTSVCAGHRMLVDDQRALDGLLFVRRMADRLRREEEVPTAPLIGLATDTDLPVPPWSARTLRGPDPEALPEPNRFECTFTEDELGRLADYRAAIKAGFYTDLFEQAGEAEAGAYRIS